MSIILSPAGDDGGAAAALVLLHLQPGLLPVHQHQHGVGGASGRGGEWLHVAHHLRTVQALARPWHTDITLYLPMSTNIYQYLYLFLLISTNIYQYLAISLISISTNIYQYPISTWHVGDQPVNVLLAAEGGDALVQDHDGVELPGLGRPPHLGPVPHGARHHGVTHPGPEPWPPADTDIVDVGQTSGYKPWSPDGGHLAGGGGQLGGHHLDPLRGRHRDRGGSCCTAAPGDEEEESYSPFYIHVLIISDLVLETVTAGLAGCMGVVWAVICRYNIDIIDITVQIM